ncbi:MAG TPA: hypothetical protein VJ385_17795 [Fibrobacteria bacterium]|nr:hypothetical protein [Fibrobacteria bacterium]
MKKNPNPRRTNTGLSLIQVNDDREAMLLKMRGKLAGLSEVHVQATERRRVAVRKSAFGWGWRIGAAAVLVLGNILYFSPGASIAAKAPEKRAPTLPHPSASLGVNDQALYWTYALYDFDMLKTRYGVPKQTVINAAVAAQMLRELLPKVDARTRFTIDRYAAQAGGSR